MYIVSIYDVKDYAKHVIQLKFTDLDKAFSYAEETWKSVDSDSIEVAIILPAFMTVKDEILNKVENINLMEADND